MPINYIQLSSWTASLNGPLIRQPLRPKHLEQDFFDDVFDYTTIFFDLFETAEGTTVAISPLEDDLTEIIEQTQFFLGGTDKSLSLCKSEMGRINFYTFSPSSSFIMGQNALGSVALSRQPNLCYLFENKNVVFTMQKDNELKWLIDWVSFYRERHQADAFLIYDNASSKYDTSTIHETMRSVFPDVTLWVVDWPFKYGAPAGDGKWDSSWSQRAALNHARLRFLQKANFVLNVDIDEYVWTSNNRPIFSYMEGRYDYARIQGVKVSSKLFSKKVPSIRDVHKIEALKNPCKWICNPKVLGDNFWSPHHISLAAETSHDSPERNKVKLAISDAFFFHLTGLRSIVANRKRLKRTFDYGEKDILKDLILKLKKFDPKNQLKISLKLFRNKFRNKLFSHMDGQKIYKLEANADEINKDKPSSRVARDMDLLYYRKMLKDFKEFVSSSKFDVVPREQSENRYLRIRLLAGELFDIHQFRSSLLLMKSLLKSDKNAKSSYYFFAGRIHYTLGNKVQAKFLLMKAKRVRKDEKNS